MEALTSLFENPFRVFMICAFIAIVLLLEGLYLLWSANKSPEAKKIEQRLRAVDTGTLAGVDASILKQRILSEVPELQRLFAHMPRLRQFDRVVEQSGVKASVGQILLIAVVAGVASYGLAKLISLPTLLSLALAITAAGLPFIHVFRQRNMRIRKLEQQLPDALDLISRALRAGHAFGSGLKMVGEEMPDPIASEFRTTHEEVSYGIALQQALLNLGARIPSTDLRYFVIAVLIQRDSGGNLTEVLGNLSALIRERFKLLQKVRVLAAEGKMSAWVLGLLPFVVAVVINIVNPGFMKILWSDPMGIKMIYTMLAMMLFGVLWMRKIIRIHV